MIQQWTKTCYGICLDGSPMPAQFIRVDEDGSMVLRAPSGKDYNFDPSSVLSVSEVDEQLQRDRIAFVLSSYVWDPKYVGLSGIVVRCTHPDDWKRSYVVYITPRVARCTCKGFGKDGACKHLAATVEKYGRPWAPKVEEVPTVDLPTPRVPAVWDEGVAAPAPFKPSITSLARYEGEW